MPQLDKFSFASQIFWLILIFLFFYWVFANFVVPNILLVLKVREKELASYVAGVDKNVDEKKNILNSYNFLVNKLCLQQDNFESSLSSYFNSLHVSFKKNFISKTANLKSLQLSFYQNNFLKNYLSKNI